MTLTRITVLLAAALLLAFLSSLQYAAAAEDSQPQQQQQPPQPQPLDKPAVRQRRPAGARRRVRPAGLAGNDPASLARRRPPQQQQLQQLQGGFQRSGGFVTANSPQQLQQLQQLQPHGASPNDRDARFLSLFTVVQFDNQPCAAASGDNGTCLTVAECASRGGMASGPCANSFGTCCVFMATCGQSTRENCTYFTNAGYPSASDGTGSCQLTIHKARPDICQFRLDFDQFNIQGPEPINHVCSNDQFIVSGGNPVPAICGVNTGNHMYVDAGMGVTNPVTLTFVTSGPSFPRNWKVKICQIPCSSTYRAEEGCLQYFTGVSGTIKSFNYDSNAGLQLSNQDYSICVRMERNFCGIQYTQCTDTMNNRTHSFTLSGNTQGQTPLTSMTGSQQCNADWLIIPCVNNVGRVSMGPATSTCVDRLCGGTLSAEISTTPSTVYSTVKPFRLAYHTNNVEAPNDAGNRGFCLNYVQQPCTNNLN